MLYNSSDSWGWIDHAASEVKNCFEVLPGDILDPHRVRTATKGYDIDLHLAALIAIPCFYRSADTYVDTNIKGTFNGVQTAQELGVLRVIHASTSKVCCTAHFVAITKNHPLQGQSSYSASKIGQTELHYPSATSLALR